jgi:hypothetical protein
MGLEFIYELYYYFTNAAYYKVTILKSGEKIKSIIQKEPSSEDGTDNFIISKDLKAAWFKIPEYCFRDGKKFLMFAEINNNLPLVRETSELVEKEGIFTKTIKITKFKIDETVRLDKLSGLPIKLVELNLPPTLVYQALEANFVKKINSEEKGKWDWLGLPLIILFIVIGVAMYMSTANPASIVS